MKFKKINLQRFAEGDPTPVNPGATAAPTEPTAPTDQTGASAPIAQPAAPAVEQTFTRSQVNQLMRNRMARYNASMLQKYGVRDAEEMAAYMEKGRKYDNLDSEHRELVKKYAYSSNGIDPQKYDDIEAYFRGKGLDLNAETLASLMESHPHWRVQQQPKTTFERMGTPSAGRPAENEAAIASRIFGVNFER